MSTRILETAELASASRTAAASRRLGVICGVGAFTWWGLVPIYFKAVKTVAPLEVLAHRVVWSAVFFLILLGGLHRLPEAAAALRSRRNVMTLIASTILVASNWLVFIWAVAHNQVLQASLGYFINPLINVLLGRVFLRERLTRIQWLSVGLSAAGVLYLTVSYGRFPAVALFLAMSFGLYGLVRKTAHVDAVVGLTVETGMLAPLAAAYMLLRGLQGGGAFLAGSTAMNVLLPLSGIITAVPLIWFVVAARRLRLTTMGFLQYIGPTMQFLLAVLAFGERFTVDHMITFGLVWSGLGLYAVDTAHRTLRAPPEVVEPA